MKPLTLARALIISLLVVPLCAEHVQAQQPISPELKEQATALAEEYAQAYRSKNVDQMMELFDPELGGDVVATYRAAFEEIFKNDFTSVDSSVTAVEATATRIAVVRISLIERYRTEGGREEERPCGHILFTRWHDDRLVLREFAQVLLGEDFDPATRVYRSSKGRYSLEIPEGWTPVKAPLVLQGIVPDSVCFIAPDLDSSCTLGFVQLPMSIEIKDAVHTDVAVTKRLTGDHRILDEGSTSVAKLDGYYVVSEFSVSATPDKSGEQLALAEGTHRRMRIYLNSPPLLYFFIFDAIPTEAFQELKPDFDALIASFTILPADEDRTPEEMVAEQLAHGAVSGRIYTSEEFNCFIAAPEGWEIRTSPNPAHLVEMQYQKGKSIARLLAAKGLPSEPDVLKTSFEGRLEVVKGIVENFNEVSRRDVTVHEVPGIESIHTYSLEGLGRFHVKEVTVVRDGIYYLILCQAMEPDSFETLEPDFDQIIESFGFIQ